MLAYPQLSVLSRFPRLLVGAAWLAMGLATVLPVGSARAAELAQRVTPEALAAALTRLDGLAGSMQRSTGVPGMAIAVVHNDQLVFLRGYGVRMAGQAGVIDPDTMFQLASLSKPVASTVVAALVGDGVVGWDDPVQRSLPEARIGPAGTAPDVTLRDLLSHRSGLPDHAGDDLEDLGFDRSTILSRLRFLPTANRFRAAYAYTNFGFTAAAEAAARASGNAWEVLSRERLYKPLGMTRTTSSHAALIAEPNRARLHVPTPQGWVARFDRDADAESPAGGVSASARDMGSWLRLQLNSGRFEAKPVLQAAALAETHRPQVISIPPADPATEAASLYGLGWNVGRHGAGLVQLSHSGAFFLGAATAVYLLPAERLDIVVLTNGQPVGLPEAVALSFLDLAVEGEVSRDYLPLLQGVFKGMLEQDYPAVVAPAVAEPSLPLERYEGRYANAYFGPLEIRRRGDALELLIGPEPQRFALTPVSGNTFSYQPRGENAFGPAAVSFEAGVGGTLTRVRVGNLDRNGLGLFTRR
ncbi:serine hydrolase [Synechococcus sp. CS-1324]|nr:serine hydrolase [Synechococcus sp. CS-1324]